MSVALCVVAFRDPQGLAELLAGAGGFDEVLVANITADPAVADVCRRLDAQEVPVEANIGFAAGVNRLAGAATSDLVLFTNDDVRLSESVPHMSRERSPRGEVVVPLLFDEDGTPQRSLRALATPARLLLEWVLLPDEGPRWGAVQKWRLPTSSERVNAATAAAVLVERQLLLCTPLPAGYFMYWEEISWFWQLRDRGVPVRFEPALRVQRRGGRSEMGTEKWRLMGRNLVRLGQERYGVRGRACYALLGVLWLTRLSLGDAFRSDRTLRWQARRAGLAGLLQGLVRNP